MRTDRWITDLDISERYPLYTRANAGEVLPDPVSPLNASLIWTATNEGWRDAYITVGTSDPDEVLPHEPSAIFGGYLYINASMTRVFGVRGPDLTPEMIDRTYFGDHPDVPPYVPAPWHERPSNTEKIGAWMTEVMGADLSVLLDDQAEANETRTSRPDLSRLSDHELVERARSLLPLVRRLFERHIIVTAGASIGPGVLAAVAEAMGDPSLALKLISDVGDVDSALPSHAMWRLSRLDPDSEEFSRGFEAFLVDYGSRGPNEWDIISDVWETKPELALALIAVMRKQSDDGDPSTRVVERRAEREAVTDTIRNALGADPETLGHFEAGLASAHAYLAGRERTKTNIIKVVNEVRVAMREVASRHGVPVDEFHQLLGDEVDAFLAGPGGFGPRMKQRLAEYRELFDREPPFIINEVVPPPSDWPTRNTADVAASTSGDVLSGVPGCPGSVTGTARVILDPSDPMALEPGDILIAPVTDPAWTPLFVPAAGVVVDVGAQVSHAIIVSRELGIPCVVSVTDATRRILDGATITVDGGAGTVTVH